MDGENRIGRFLRARRELVRPEDVDLPDFGRRRVPGLRREELAMLAGVSADYYVRLEQGRDQHPSEQVLDALARALRLDDDATAHLHELTRPAPRRRRRAPGRAERVRPSLLALVDSWTHTPAFVLGRCLDVLASNRLAGALHPTCARGGNMVRMAFLDESAIERMPDLAEIRHDTVAALRASIGPDLDDPRLTDLVGELSLKSEEFRRLWARHDVREKTNGRKRIVHPQVGELDLAYESLAVNGADGQILVIYHADVGSPTEQALALLSSITAGDATPPSSRTARPSTID